MNCPYCGREVEWKSNSEHIYGVDFGPIYECEPCDARVGCHKRAPKTPLGTLANAELREWRRRAHFMFDRLWKSGKVRSRREAYQQLADHFGEPEVHIGESDVKWCMAIVAYAWSKDPL